MNDPVIGRLIGVPVTEDLKRCEAALLEIVKLITGGLAADLVFQPEQVVALVRTHVDDVSTTPGPESARWNLRMARSEGRWTSVSGV